MIDENGKRSKGETPIAEGDAKAEGDEGKLQIILIFAFPFHLLTFFP
jgi:hypothetical protein